MICVLFVICIYVRAPWENSSCELNGLPYEFINNNNNNNNMLLGQSDWTYKTLQLNEAPSNKRRLDQETS